MRSTPKRKHPGASSPHPHCHEDASSCVSSLKPRTCDSAEKAQLCLFGSSKNGFGFRDSDLDICMTLEGHETAEVKAECLGSRGRGLAPARNNVLASVRLRR